MCSKFPLAIGFILAISILVGAQTTAPTKTDHTNLSPDKFPSKIEELLGIQDHDSDILPTFELALRKTNAPPDEFAKAMNDLVDAVLKGPSPNVLLEQLLPQVEIGSTSTTATKKAPWKWGSVSERMALVSKMGKLAAQMRQSDPKRASEIGRCALLLAALDDFGHQWSAILAVNDEASKRDKNMETLLNLPEGHHGTLEKLISDRQAAHDRFQSLKYSAVFLVDKIGASNGAVKIEDVRVALAKLDEAFKQASIQYGYQSEVIEVTWKLLNLVRARNSQVGVAAVSEQLEKWDKNSESVHVKRWIGQALARVGPAPHPMIGVELVDENGKTVKITNLAEMTTTKPKEPEEPKK